MSGKAHRHSENSLLNILDELNDQEEQCFSALACLSRHALRRQPEALRGHRQPFAQDADRILHSRAYTRYIDKTQVFSLINNDHISHRVLHVQIVSRIARTIGRFLGLNEDLIEAMALGHDIGHPPFGHEGERILARLCRKHGLDGFQHNIQSVQFLDRFEKKGQGLNLTLQVLDGILCHDGEAHATLLAPQRDKNFDVLDREMADKAREPMTRIAPMTLEGCVVRISDTIAYIGRDIEDAIELELISRDEIPVECGKRLGTSNGTIVYTLVADLIASSSHVRKACLDVDDHDRDWIGFSQEISARLLELKRFNYERIYRNPAFKPDFKKIHRCYERLFEYYLEQVEQDDVHSDVNGGFINSMSENYRCNHSSSAFVRDYIAGMTDDYFLRQAKKLGCDIPKRTCLPN
ncbi:MAG: HD domain-containing protein [Desulfobulbaceae bacterium]|nr:HD domain-containing protein [Desulfobulbaceae bacterium]